VRVRDESVNRLYVMANESYEDFATSLQAEYEADCGVTFGKVPLTALAKLTRVVDSVEQPVGRNIAEALRGALVEQGILDVDGRITAAFTPAAAGFALELPEALRDLAPGIIDLLLGYQIERHVRRERDEGTNRLKKEVLLTPEFAALWDRIKPRTTYRVEFETEALVRRAVDGLKRAPRIEAPSVRIVTGQLDVSRGGVSATATNVVRETTVYRTRPMPDILAYLQNETDLTRATIARILRESGRLSEAFVDAQRFLDQVCAIIRHELHRLLVDGIKYERLAATGPESEWEVRLFRNDELVNYLSALRVQNSIYEYVVYDSDVEREFAQALDSREDIKLFVKLPAWFKVETPLGSYNPDWAILKHNGQAFYLVRETKATRDFLKLRSSEADKVRCGSKHFATLGVDFEVAVTADEV
jgi:type III restriction enzyme